MELHLQNEALCGVMPQRSPEDGLIDWSQDARVVDRLIRAQTHPYPGAFTLSWKRLYIWRSRIDLPFPRDSKFGQVHMAASNEFVVSCANGCIY